MALQVCSRCLARASVSSSHSANSFFILPITNRQSPFAFKSSFSTSSALAVNPPKKTVVQSKRASRPDKGKKQTFVRKSSKRSTTDRGKRPAVGERKALRKRVVLSNTNALDVKGLEDFEERFMTDVGSVGKVVGIPGSLVDRLRIVQAFKPSQGWSLFRRPAMLIREETVEYGKLMQELAASKKSVRRVLVGERGSGKSVMLLQAMAMAMIKSWVVISIPDAMDITIAHTSYAPLPSTSPLQYTQPDYTASFLLSISRANPVLQTLKLSQPPPQPQSSPSPQQQQQQQRTPTIPIPPNISLSRLCQLGAESPETAYSILELLLSELKLPGRPPLLFALDGLGFAMRPTKYIDGTHYRPIHAHDFTIISTFLSHLSGTAPLPNGGLVLAAVSESNRPRVEAMELALAQIEGLEGQGKAKGEVARDPFKAYDARVMGVFEGKGVQVQRMGGLGRSEARSLMEYWARSGIVRGVIGEKEVGEKWAISGGGVIGELERACVRMRV